MRKVNFILAILVMVVIAACSKNMPLSNNDGPSHPDSTDQPIPDTSGPNKPDTTNPDSIFIIRVKAKIIIGEIVFDSIPATLLVSSWDSAGQLHQKQISLLAGTNVLPLVRAHVRYQLRIMKWGIIDEAAITKESVNEGAVIELGGSKPGKKLRMEEGYLFAGGLYQPQSKTLYAFNGNGTIDHVDYYQKKPQQQDLKLYTSDHYSYEGITISEIRRYNEFREHVGTTSFSYDNQQEITGIHQSGYGNETSVAISYKTEGLARIISMDYLFNNGHSMTYSMRFANGNKVSDNAVSSAGGSEGGTYAYDSNINPFANMKIPDLFLSNYSKNNLVGQHKNYAGSIPAGEPYRYEYNYDQEGYPVSRITYYKSYVTGNDLYKTKTVYTY